jgi:hypothetical protein
MTDERDRRRIRSAPVHAARDFHVRQHAAVLERKAFGRFDADDLVARGQRCAVKRHEPVAETISPLA